MCVDSAMEVSERMRPRTSLCEKFRERLSQCVRVIVYLAIYSEMVGLSRSVKDRKLMGKSLSKYCEQKDFGLEKDHRVTAAWWRRPQRFGE